MNHTLHFNPVIRSGLVSLAYFTIAVGLLVIAGWIFDIPLLKSVLPEYQTMKLNTAIGFLVAGIALLLLITRKSQGIVIALCVFLFLLGAASLTEDIFEVNFSIDELFVRDTGTLHETGGYPGRPAPSTSLCFMLIAAALFFIASKQKRLFTLSQYLLHLVTLISFLAVTGYLFNVPAFYKLYFLTSMAVHTSVLLLLLSVGISLINCRLGLTGLFFDERIGNIMTRTLFPQLVLILMVIGMFILLAYRNKWLTEEFGIALHTTLFVLVALFLIGSNAGRMNKIEDERNRSNEIYRDLFQNALVGVITSEMQTLKPIMVNEVAARLFGYGSTEEFLKQYIPQKHFQYYSDRLKNIDVLLQQGELITPVQELKKLDGTRFWVKLFIKLNADQSIAQAVLVDVSEQVISQNRLRDKVRELESVNKELETFSYITSHDLQEPLRKVRNFVTALQKSDESNLSEEGKYYLKRMFSTAKTMQSLIGDLLLYSRIKNSARQVELLNMNEVTTDVISELKTEGKNGNVRFDIQKLCELHANRSQMEILLKNLFDNSIKFSHPERQPVIEVRSVEGSGKQLGIEKLEEEQLYCHISITDNGIGFEPKYNERVFDIFERLHGQDRYSGTGIGLPICKRIVENHGGIIIASGQVDKGVRIDIYLPNSK